MRKMDQSASERRVSGAIAGMLGALAVLVVACGDHPSPPDPDVGSSANACTVEQPDVAAPIPPISLATGQACANDLALVGGVVSWVTLGASTGSPSGGTVAMKPIAGGPVTAPVDVDQGQRLVAYGDDVYWAGRSAIGRVHKDGSGQVVLVTDSVTPLAPRDLAVDATYVYFTTGSSVKAVPRGGGSVIVLASGQARPTGLAVDDTYVYWTNQGTSSALNGTIVRRPKAGGSNQTIVTGQARPDRIAVDDTYVFWSNLGTDSGGSTGWVNGSVMSWLKTGSGAPVTMTPATWPTDIALDSVYVYFTESRANTIKKVGRRSITGGVTLVATNEPGIPTAIAVDDTNVYWTLGCGAAADGVRVLPKDAIAASNCFTTPRQTLHSNVPGSFSETGTWIYYGDRDGFGLGTLHRLWRNGGPPETLQRWRNPIGRVIADSQGVVWTETSPTGTSLHVLRNQDTAAVLLASGLSTTGPLDLILDSTHAYWLDALGPHKVIRDGTSAAVLMASTTGQPKHIAQSPMYVFWTEDLSGQARVRRVSKTTGSLQLTFSTAGTVGDLQVDGSTVYVVVHGSATSAIHAVSRSGGTPQILAQGPFHPRDLYEPDDGVLFFTSDSGPTVDAYRLLATGELTPLADVAGTVGDIDADSRCVVWGTTELDGHGALWKVSRSTFGVLAPSQKVVYQAQLNPVNAEAQGILPVTGTATFTVQDGQLTVDVNTVNMPVGVTHPQHMHRRGPCPTLATDDDNGDGFVDVVEALGAAGGVIVPLDPDLPYLGTQLNFPAPDANGVEAFRATTTIDALEIAINKALEIDTRTVMIHGVSPSFPFPPTVQGIDGVPPHRNIPLACGRLVRVQ